ncbi:class E sortase [Nocardioides sp. YIM 152315]|uniref:class E sortase n=1 Tax=Nocardioides sp. YIM 152315 TaxID=3031760 RepID=UPI0023DB9E9B|nr:class E sortase [Nocardioides sp. YIM 152315]MDF1606070.1 class E sortase [Nocardioides sp. YIM 152315]
MSGGRGRSRALLWSGIALVVAGPAVLGYISWQLYGTTWVAKREQDRIVRETEQAWESGQGSASGRASDVAALIRIPAFGDEYVVPAHVGTDDDTLARGFGIFEDAAEPGAVGNFALSGHRITHGEPLRGMPDLEAGDEVVVETRSTTYTYELVTDGDALTVDLDAGWVVEPDPTDPRTGERVSTVADSRRLITLVTCAELFHTDDRLVAFGRLVSEDPR